MMKRSTGILGLLFCSSMLGGVAQAQILAATPPPRIPVDAHGVNIVTGYYTAAASLLRIGSTTGGLAVSRQYLNQGWRESYIGTIQTPDNATYYVSIGGGSDAFVKSGSTYTNALGQASTLTFNTSNSQYTYTTSDGTIYIFGNPVPLAYNAGPWFANGGRLLSITHTDGQKDNYAYQNVSLCGGAPNAKSSNSSSLSAASSSASPQAGTPCNKISRLNTITSNTGYQITLSYDDINANYFNMIELDGSNLVTGSGVITSAYVSYSGSSGTSSDGFIQHSYSYDAHASILTDTVGTSPTSTKTLTYDASERVSTINDGYATYTYTYADSGTTRTTTVSGPTGSKTYVSDTGTTLVASVADELSHKTNFSYDGSGRLQQVTNPEGTVSPAADATQYAYDARGNITSVTNVPKAGSGLGNIVTQASFDATCSIIVKCNKPNYTLDAKGFETDYTYDGTHGGVTSVTLPAPSSGAVRPQTRYSYTANTAPYSSGTIYRLTGTSACATTSSCSGGADETRGTIAYGTNLLPTTVTSAAGNGAVSLSSSFTWSSAGDIYTTVGPLGSTQTSRYRYGSSHQLLGVVGPDPDGSGPLAFRAVRYTYDARGLTTSVEQGTVPSQSDSDWTNFSSLLQQTSTYDGASQKLTDAIVSSGTTRTLVQYSYNSLGLLQCTATRDPAYASSLPANACSVTSSTVAGADQIKQINYDAVGHAISNLEGVGTSDAATVATLTYAADGEQATAADANGYLTTFVYDGFNRLITIEFPNPSTPGQSQTTVGGIETYTYDANSNRTSLVRRTGGSGNTITYGYDNLNRLTALTQPNTTATFASYSYSYDNFARLTSMSSTQGYSHSFTYDQLSRKTGETSPLGTIASTWDAGGRRARLTWPDGYYANYGYDVAGELTSVQDSSGANLASLTYDNFGRRVSLSHNSGVTTTYNYDAASRLASIAHSLPSGQSQTESYTYNAANQVQTKSGSNDGWAWNGGHNFDSAYGANGLNEQTSAGSATLSWSGKGVLSGDGTNSYAYDIANQLVTGNSSSQFYDGAGRLYSVGASGATRFVYDGDFAAAEYNTSGVVVRRFVPGPNQDEPLTWYEGAGTATRYGLTTDRMGSVTGVTNDAGGLSAVNSYDEYGVPGTSNAGRYQYTGQKFLSEIGLYNYKARNYYPTIGRFVQPDPIGYGDGMNIYNYVHNDPMNGLDSTGLVEQCAPGSTDFCEIIIHADGGSTGGLGGGSLGNTSIPSSSPGDGTEIFVHPPKPKPTSPVLINPPQNTQKQQACRAAATLDKWSKQDAKAALAYSAGGAGAALVGAEPAAAVLEAVAGVRELSAAVEAGGAGLLTYYSKGNIVPFAASFTSYVLGKAAGSGFGPKPAIKSPAIGAAGLLGDAIPTGDGC